MRRWSVVVFAEAEGDKDEVFSLDARALVEMSPWTSLDITEIEDPESQS